MNTQAPSRRGARHTIPSRLRPVLAGCCISLALAAHGDAVITWNQTADATSVFAGAPPFRNRVTAMAQIAVHDALNSIVPRYESYADIPRAAEGASIDAAVAAAAYRVLVQTVPSRAVPLGLAYTSWIDALPDCPPATPTCIEDGVAAGEAAAQAILAIRTGDGSATPHLPYTLPPGPGVYQPTPPANAAPQFAGWAKLEPFGIFTQDQFRMDPSRIFDLTSEEYTRDFNEVKRVGAANSELLGQRTADQSAIAIFWPNGGANHNAVTRAIVNGRGMDPWEHARLLALVTMAVSDATIAAFDTKYTYNFWRPVTAIRAAGTDGNPDTDPDPGWSSFQATPPYPDYTCGLTNNTGSGFEVLRRFLGTDDVPYTLTVTVNNVGTFTRSFTSLSQAGNESVDARVFGGMHFRTGCVMGLRQGAHVGHFIFRHYLRPLRGRKG